MPKLQDKGCYTSNNILQTKDEIYVPAKQLTCEEGDCGPPPGMPNYLCSDGETMAGPGACIENADGACNWEIIECPAIISGYLREMEVSACQDACGQYYLESESGEYLTNIADIEVNNLLTSYVDRFVGITGEDVWCVECGAVDVETITLTTACENPVVCFVDPCLVTSVCAADPNAECIANYCGGCHADFYDSSGTLVDCNAPSECPDVGNVFFGLCDMYMGIAVVNDQCQGVSGCGWVVDGIDHSDAFFDSIEACETACDSDDTTCDEIAYDYEQLLNNDLTTTCNTDNDCVAVWGDCGVGLGGCHYSVNAENYPEGEINDLVDQWVDGDCMEWVCDCMAEPYAQCIDNTCTSAYCMDDNPAGCFQTGCDEGYECLGYSETNDCTPSSCFCSENGDWYCTEDCGGGSCVEIDVNMTCDEIAYDYEELLNNDLNTTCSTDNDCVAVWGDCGVGLGGCHYSVNAENYPEGEISDLVNQWVTNECTAGVCDCASPPYAQCIDNTCTSVYCMDDNPAGCIQTGCDEGYECNSDPNDCTPSLCMCDESNDAWYCTEDCGGGSCYISEPGDINLDTSVNVQDIIALINFILATEVPTAYEHDAADMNADNNLDVLDVVGIVNLILGTCESCLASGGSWSIGQCFETECGSALHPTDVGCWQSEPSQCPTPLDECLSYCWVSDPVCANETTYQSACAANCHEETTFTADMCDSKNENPDELGY